MGRIILFLSLLFIVLAFKVPPDTGKVSQSVSANNTIVVNTLQATAEFSVEAHNGVGWTSTYIAPGTNNFCSLTYSQSFAASSPQTGCAVFYDVKSNRYFLQAFSGYVGSSSWCKARCITWS